jgi:hypothetical protein
MLKKVISVLLVVSMLFSNVEYCFTDEEVTNIFNGIHELEYKDSINVEIQITLESQIKDYELFILNDSTIISNIEYQLELKDELIEEITPEWYEHRYLWFGFGVVSILIPIWLIGKVK